MDYSQMIHIRTATNAARARLNNERIGVAVENGLFQIVEVTFLKGGNSDVRELSQPMPVSEIIPSLERLTA